MDRWVLMSLLVALCVSLGAWIGLEQRTWHRLATLGQHHAPVVATAISGDGVYGAAMHGDGHVKVWELATRRLVASRDLKLVRGSTIERGRAALALSPDGSLLAASSPATRTVVWRINEADPAADLVRLPMGLPGDGYAVLLAMSHANDMVATLDVDDQLRLWQLDPVHELGSRRTSYGVEMGIRLEFSQHGLFIGLFRSDSPLGRWWRINDLAVAPMEAGGARGPMRFTLAGRPYQAVESASTLEDPQATPPNDEFRGVLVIPRSREAARPIVMPFRDMSVRDPHLSIRLTHERALHGRTRGRTDLLGTMPAGARFRSPWPYLSVILLTALIAWSGLKRPIRRDSANRSDSKLIGTPLPTSFKIAAITLICLGGLALGQIIWSISHGHLNLNLAPLLLLAGFAMLRRRSEGWRRFTLVVAVLGLSTGGMMVGSALAGGSPHYEVGGSAYYFPPGVDLVPGATLLTLAAWLTWAIGQRRVRVIFAAARYARDDGLNHLRACVKCGYDVRASVAAGQPQCPECGHRLMFDDTMRHAVAKEFEQKVG